MLDQIATLYPASFPLQFEQLRIAAALLGTGAATYYDIANNRNVPNALLYAFFAAALLISVFASGEHLIFTLAVSAIIFAAGWVFYKAGQIGGADVFVLASISLLLPVQPVSLLAASPAAAQALALPFALYVFAAAGLLFILAMLAYYSPGAIALLAKGRLKISPLKWAYFGALAALYAAFLYFAQSVPFVPPFYTALLGILAAASAFFMLFREHVREQMLEYVPFSKIEEEDVLGLEHIGAGLAEKYQIPRVVGKDDLDRLKKSKIALKKWPVYKKMHVFLPYILIALIALLLLGDPFAFLSGL